MKNAGMGPVTTATSLERIQALVEESVNEGAELAAGGKRGEGFGRGHWFEPTVHLRA